MRVKATIKGEREVIAKFKRMSKAARGEALAGAARTGIQPIQNEAIVLVAKDTSTLARSLHTEIAEQRATYAEAISGTDVEYARRIEFGFSGVDSLGRHYNQPAQPYYRPAYDTKRGEAIRDTSNALRDIILGSV